MAAVKPNYINQFSGTVVENIVNSNFKHHKNFYRCVDIKLNSQNIWHKHRKLRQNDRFVPANQSIILKYH